MSPGNSGYGDLPGRRPTGEAIAFSAISVMIIFSRRSTGLRRHPSPTDPTSRIIMNYLLLKTLHIAGVIGLFTSLGALLAESSPVCKKRATILHGISLLLIAVAGFAMLRKPPMDQHWWMVEAVIWLYLGVVPVLVKRTSVPRPLLLVLSLLAGATAAYLGMAKPF